jgi:hypothetical protein
MASTVQCGMDIMLPDRFQRTVIDPAPPASESSALRLSNAATAVAAPHPVAPSPTEVVQQFAFEFVFSVPRLSASSTDKALVFPFNGIIECANSVTPTLNLWVVQPFNGIIECANSVTPTLNLWVVQPCYPQNSRVLRGYTWEIWFETGKLETIQADDSGPAFTEAALTKVTVCPASIPDDGGFSYNRSTHFWTHKVHRQLDHAATAYEVPGVNCALVVVICKFVFSRRFCRREWNRFSCKRVPAPKNSLLDSAARTGDVTLQGGVSLTLECALLNQAMFAGASKRKGIFLQPLLTR